LWPLLHNATQPYFVYNQETPSSGNLGAAKEAQGDYEEQGLSDADQPYHHVVLGAWALASVSRYASLAAGTLTEVRYLLQLKKTAKA
jgi:hypothetical protein